MTPAQSPYEVPVHSVAAVSVLEGPLQPFEQDQLKRLINQVNAAPVRVRAAFAQHVSSSGISLD